MADMGEIEGRGERGEERRGKRESSKSTEIDFFKYLDRAATRMTLHGLVC